MKIKIFVFMKLNLTSKTMSRRNVSYTPQSNAVLSISAATRLLYNMGNIFRSTVPMNYNKAQHIDRKRRAELARLRRTHGVKGNDYEQNI